MCACTATDVLADDLLPNKTLRDTINRILESGNSSAENAGSMCQVQGISFSHSQSFIFVFTIIGKLMSINLDMESARCPPPKVLSPTTSAASGSEKKPAPSNNNEISTLKPSIEILEITSTPRASAEIVKVEKPVDASENIQGSSNGKEAAVSQLNAQAPKEEMPQQVASGEQGNHWVFPISMRNFCIYHI